MRHHKYQFESGGFRNGLCAVSLNGKMGCIDKKGKEVIPLKFESAYVFVDGLAAVSIIDSKTNERGMGFIDKKGNFVIPPVYHKIYFNEEAVQEDENFEYFFEGNIIALNKEGKFGLINNKGKVVIPFEYEIVYFTNSPDRFVVEKDEKFAYVDLNNKHITPFKYDQLDIFYGNLAEYKLNGKFGIINYDGQEITPAIYDEVFIPDNDLKEDLIAVKVGKLYGFINAKGEEVIPIKYEHFYAERDVYKKIKTYFTEGLCFVGLNHKYGFIDLKGNEVIPLMYSWSLYGFHEGGAWVQDKPSDDGGKYGFIDKNNQYLIPSRYDSVNPFVNGRAQVTIDKKTFEINLKGECVKDCQLAPKDHP